MTPNFLFLSVQFLHLLALSLWMGGVVLLVFVARPTLLQSIESWTKAHELVSEMARRFDGILSVCILLLAATSVTKIFLWDDRDSGWIWTRYGALALMSLSGLFSIRVISPNIRAFKSRVQNYDALPPAHIDRLLYHRLHTLYVGCMTVSLLSGLVALYLE